MITRTTGTMAGGSYLQWLPKLRVGIDGGQGFADTSALRITSCPDTAYELFMVRGFMKLAMMGRTNIQTSSSSCEDVHLHSCLIVQLTQ
jgi:hypothetical protein